MKDELEYLEAKFLEDIEKFKRSLASGRQESYEAYKYTCGLIRGLSYAIEHVNYLQQRQKEYDNE